VTIDFAYRLVNLIANKEQKGIIKGAEFNQLAIEAQLEAILTILGAPEREDNRFITPIGFKVNQQAKEQILPLIKKSPVLVLTLGMAPYPTDYLAYDNLERADGTQITIIENDQLGRMKKSVITPPVEDEPYACFHGEGIEIAPAFLTDVYMYYVKMPQDPNWDYTITNDTEIYNGTSTPQLSGKISYGFDAPRRLHKKICMIILKYLGINLSDTQLAAFATQIQERNP